ncbi:unnamed protein product, partial [Linum tenue]
ANTLNESNCFCFSTIDHRIPPPPPKTPPTIEEAVEETHLSLFSCWSRSPANISGFDAEDISIPGNPPPPQQQPDRRGALLGSRFSGFVFCLISLAVLAADKDQGWALESFYRYKEFRQKRDRGKGKRQRQYSVVSME